MSAKILQFERPDAGLEQEGYRLISWCYGHGLYREPRGSNRRAVLAPLPDSPKPHWFIDRRRYDNIHETYDSRTSRETALFIFRLAGMNRLLPEAGAFAQPRRATSRANAAKTAGAEEAVHGR